MTQGIRERLRAAFRQAGLSERVIEELVGRDVIWVHHTLPHLMSLLVQIGRLVRNRVWSEGPDSQREGRALRDVLRRETGRLRRLADEGQSAARAARESRRPRARRRPRPSRQVGSLVSTPPPSPEGPRECDEGSGSDDDVIVLQVDPGPGGQRAMK